MSFFSSAKTKLPFVLAVIASLVLTGCSSTPKGVWSAHGKWSAVTPVEYAEKYCYGYADMAAELSVAGQQVPQPSSPQATRTTYGYDVKAKCKRDALGNYDCTGVPVPNVQSTLANSGAQVGQDIGSGLEAVGRGIGIAIERSSKRKKYFAQCMSLNGYEKRVPPDTQQTEQIAVLSNVSETAAAPSTQESKTAAVVSPKKSKGKYSGQSKDGKRHGIGTQDYPNGAKYYGNWADNLRHGEGTYFDSEGRVLEGTWVNGKLDGYVTQTFPNGEVYEGLARAGEHKYGVLTCLDGTTIDLYWENGKLISGHACPSSTK